LYEFEFRVFRAANGWTVAQTVPRRTYSQTVSEGAIYFTGNSLGLQPKTTKLHIEQELRLGKLWASEGHFSEESWMPYHEFSDRTR